jgi:hypothetical protein
MAIDILDYFGGNVIEAGIEEIGKWANKDLEKYKLEQDYYKSLLESQTREMLGQIEVNKSESKSRSLFVAGWRPFIGWVSGLALMFTFVCEPFLHALLGIWNINFSVELETVTLYNLVLSMLGIAGLRTYEKLKKIDTKEIK